MSSQLVATCPRCKSSNVAFTLKGEHYTHRQNPWYTFFDAFCICSHCNGTVIFHLRLNNYDLKDKSPLQLPSVNSAYEILGYQSMKDHVAATPPEHLPEKIAAAFKEGATCLAVDCHNAGATMFRMCLDIATKALVPVTPPMGLTPLTPHVQKNLGPRVGWLLDNEILPAALKDLAQCVKDDGNAGAHDGTLKKVDAEDLMDFTSILLERLYTEPKRLELAAERRAQRHTPPTT